jgi:hypothetical protein
MLACVLVELLHAGIDKELVTIQEVLAFWNMNYHPQTFQSNHSITKLALYKPNLPPLNYTLFATNFTSKLRSLANAGFPANVPQKVDTHFLHRRSGTNQCPKNQTCEGPNGPVMMLIVCEQVYGSCKAI